MRVVTINCQFSLCGLSHDVQNGISYDFDFVRWSLHFEFPSYTSVEVERQMACMEYDTEAGSSIRREEVTH